MKQKKAFENMEILNITEEDIDKELESIKSELDLYNIEYPPQYEIDKCVENLSIYMNKKKSRKQVLKEILQRTEIELSYINKFYWIINIAVFLIAFGFAVSTNLNPYGMVAFVSPIPLALGIIEILKGRENSMIELELSFKISAKEIIFIRIMIMSIFNILLNTSMCAVLFKRGLDVQLLQMNIFWVIPFVWINFIALLIAKKVRSHYVSLSIVCVWMVASSMVFSNKRILENIMGINIISYVVIALIGGVLLFLQVKSYMKMDIEGFICDDGRLDI